MWKIRREDEPIEQCYIRLEHADVLYDPADRIDALAGSLWQARFDPKQVQSQDLATAQASITSELHHAKVEVNG